MEAQTMPSHILRGPFTERLEVRVTAAQQRKLERLADQVSLTPSHVIRYLIESAGPLDIADIAEVLGAKRT